MTPEQQLRLELLRLLLHKDVPLEHVPDKLSLFEELILGRSRLLPSSTGDTASGNTAA